MYKRRKEMTLFDWVQSKGERTQANVDIVLTKSSIDYVINAVAEVCCVSPKEMGRKCRKRGLVEARFMYYKLMHMYSDCALDVIGEPFNQDHTMVIYGTRTATNLMAGSQSFLKLFEKVYSKLKVEYPVHELNLNGIAQL